MKTALKHLVLCFVLFAGISIGRAQFTLGPKIGVNFTNFVEYTDFNSGMDAGLFMRLGQRFYFQPEFDYSFRKSIFKDGFEEIKQNFDLKTHFFDIPLLIGYKFVSLKNFNFRVFVGPRLGFMINNSLEEYDALKTMQIGGQAGIGIDVWRFTFDVKYDFSGNRYESQNDDSWWKQNMFNIALGFKIFKK